MKKQHDACPCGSDIDYETCCGRYHSGEQDALTAEVLMRSRYSAYVLGNEDYLLKTWHETTRPQSLELDKDNVTKWNGLAIRSTEKGTEQDDHGVVEFIARYKINGKAHHLHEISRFNKEHGQWFYVDGDLQT